MRNIFMLVAAVLAILAAVLILAGPSMQRAFFYPKPRALPAIVSQSTDGLLKQLQIVLEMHAPQVARSLQPGLSGAQIAALEVQGGFHLSEDLRAFYRWHNGMPRSSTVVLLPGHRFIPLEEVVQERILLSQQLESVSIIQRLAFGVFASHRKGWVQLLNDGAGDGYFYDPERTASDGAFFFHFAETRSFMWFPSFRNFLAGVIEAYETGAIHVSIDGNELDEEYEKTEKIWARLVEFGDPEK